MGEHAEDARKLLNELARAKAVLLDSVKRAQYDVLLGGSQEPARAALSKMNRTPKHKNNVVPLVEPVQEPQDVAPVDPASQTSFRRSRSGRSSAGVLPSIDTGVTSLAATRGKSAPRKQEKTSVDKESQDQTEKDGRLRPERLMLGLAGRAIGVVVICFVIVLIVIANRGDGAYRGKKMTIKRGDGGLAQRKFEIYVSPSSVADGGELMIAKVWIDDKQKLFFQWTKEARDEVASSALRNCKIEFRTVATIHDLTFRDPAKRGAREEFNDLKRLIESERKKR